MRSQASSSSIAVPLVHVLEPNVDMRAPSHRIYHIVVSISRRYGRHWLPWYRTVRSLRPYCAASPLTTGPHKYTEKYPGLVKRVSQLFQDHSATLQLNLHTPCLDVGEYRVSDSIFSSPALRHQYWRASKWRKDLLRKIIKIYLNYRGLLLLLHE